MHENPKSGFFYLFCLVFFFIIPLHSEESDDLSTFSVKSEGLMLSIPKIHRWRYYPSTKTRGKIFSLNSRNKNFGIVLFKLSVDDSSSEILGKMGWETLRNPTEDVGLKLLQEESSRYLELSRGKKKAVGIEFFHNKTKYFYFVHHSGNGIDINLTKQILDGVEKYPPILPLDKNYPSGRILLSP